MGCDIHMVVEADSARGRYGTEHIYWVPVTPRCWSCDGTTKGCWSCYGSGVGVWHDRSYDVFAVLANVRNGTWGDLPPLSQPRGVPQDCSVVPDCFGGHSQSWVTLAELLAYNWDATFKRVATVDWLLTELPTLPELANRIIAEYLRLVSALAKADGK